jgi:hypothetical protein
MEAVGIFYDHLVYFMYGHLVYFVAIRYSVRQFGINFPRFGNLCQEKSGNPEGHGGADCHE